MNENAKKWVTALKSGDYKQTKGTLRDGEGFCCLGVACDLSGLGEWVQLPDDDRNPDDTRFAYVIGGYKHTDLLPEEVRLWLGLEGISGEYEIDEGLDPLVEDEETGELPEPTNRELTDDNDEGATFAEIAKIIEENWASLKGAG